MRSLFRWLFRVALVLLIVLVLLAIAAALLKDPVAKSMAEKNLRDGTGMDAKIAKLEVGLMTPTVHLEGMKLYNPPEFGGGTFLDMPELRMEYVPGEIRGGKLHFKTVRLNLAEVHVVRGKDGKTNLDSIQNEAKKKSGGQKKGTDAPGIDFGGIDTLYLTIGRIKITDLRDPKNNREIRLGLKDEVGRNLKTEEEIAGWFALTLTKLLWQQRVQSGGKPGDLEQLLRDLKLDSSSR